MPTYQLVSGPDGHGEPACRALPLRPNDYRLFRVRLEATPVCVCFLAFSCLRGRFFFVLCMILLCDYHRNWALACAVL